MEGRALRERGQDQGPSPVSPFRYPLIAARLLAMLLALIGGVVLYGLCACFTRSNPAPRLFLGALGRICGLRVRIIGKAAGKNTVILANHMSWLDIPALSGACGCAFVAHDGLSSIGPLRWLCELNDTVFVARHDRRSVGAQIAQVRKALSEVGLLTIFPEGTTGDGVTVLPFKSSLLSALDGQSQQLAVQPVHLDYGDHAREIAWLGEESGIANAMRILSRWRPIPLTIRFLEPLAPEDRADRKAMARAARDAILAAAHAKPLIS